MTGSTIPDAYHAFVPSLAIFVQRGDKLFHWETNTTMAVLIAVALLACGVRMIIQSDVCLETASNQYVLLLFICFGLIEFSLTELNIGGLVEPYVTLKACKLINYQMSVNF
jgi:hypothetical protein